MTLEEHRIKRGLSISETAAALGVDRVTIWRWLTGKSIPEAPMILRIQAWSKGDVRANDWIGGNAE